MLLLPFCLGFKLFNSLSFLNQILCEFISSLQLLGAKNPNSNQTHPAVRPISNVVFH